MSAKVVEALKRLHSDLAELNGGTPPQWVDVTCKQHIAAAEQRAAEDPTQRALRDAALAQMATWCDDHEQQARRMMDASHASAYAGEVSAYRTAAAEARRLAAGPLPLVVRWPRGVAFQRIDRADLGDGVLLLPPSKDAP